MLNSGADTNCETNQKIVPWRIAQGQVYQFGCIGLDAADVLLKFTTSKCV